MEHTHNTNPDALCVACEIARDEYEQNQAQFERIDDYNVFEENQIALDNYYESLEMVGDYDLE